MKGMLLGGMCVFTAFCSQAVSAQSVLSATEDNSDFICTSDGVPLGAYAISFDVVPELADICRDGEVTKLGDVDALGATMFVCAGSPMPGPAWVIESVASVAGCPSQNGWRIRDSAGETLLFICNGSPIPDGWVITAQASGDGWNYSCPGVAFRIENAYPPPVEPEPEMPPAVMQPIEIIGSGHMVRWMPGAGVPVSDCCRYVLERMDNNSGWNEIYKGNRYGEAVVEYWVESPAVGVTYSYRVRPIVSSSNGPGWSSVVTVQH